jgi:hypothetical protein
MICVSCGRALNYSSVTVGKMHMGPVCAKKAGLLQSKKIAKNRLSAKQASQVENKDQFSLF